VERVGLLDEMVQAMATCHRVQTRQRELQLQGPTPTIDREELHDYEASVA
jgi:hypothetical protein